MMSTYIKINFPNFSNHVYGHYIFSSPGEEDLYQGQLWIVKTYLNTQSCSNENSEQQCILSALQNVIEQVEAVYHCQDRDLNIDRSWHRSSMPKRERAERFDETLKQLNEVLANIRLIYLPIDYGMNFSIALYVDEKLNTEAANMRQLAYANYNTSLAYKMANLQLLSNQLPGASNRHYRNLGIALLLLALLSACLIIVIANPSIVGIVAGKHMLEMTLISITGFFSCVGSLTFFTVSISTPKLAQAVQALPSPQQMTR